MVNKNTGLTAALLESFAPSHCLVCGLRSHRPLSLCLDCESRIGYNLPACPTCAEPMPEDEDAAGDEPCGQCQQHPPPLAAAIAPRSYSYPVDRLVRALKFQRLPSALPVLVELAAPEIAAQVDATPDALLPMPMHWWRRWRRGFNQAELLARALAVHPALGAVPLTVRPGIARRRRHTTAQAGLSASQRRRNLHDSFCCPRRIDGAHIAIVDDVMTTGTSAYTLAQALQAAGAGRVDLWCIARTPGPSAGVQ